MADYEQRPSIEGSGKGRTKLTAVQVLAIRRLVAAGAHRTTLAAALGVGISTVQQVVSGRSWRWLQEQDPTTYVDGTPVDVQPPVQRSPERYVRVPTVEPVVIARMIMSPEERQWWHDRIMLEAADLDPDRQGDRYALRQHIEACDICKGESTNEDHSDG